MLGDAGVYFVPAVIIDPAVKTRQRLKGYTFPVLVAMDKPLPLQAVDFSPESASLLPIAELQLEQLAQFVSHSPGCVVELIVTVAGRDNELCYNLSLERGRAMRDLLLANGVDPSSVTVSAYGNVGTKNGEGSAVAVRFREK